MSPAQGSKGERVSRFGRPLCEKKKNDELTEKQTVLFEDVSTADKVSEKKYQCKKCPFTTSLTAVFKSHANQHGANKNLECNKCDFSTFRIDHMRKHKVVHKGQAIREAYLARRDQAAQGTLSKRKPGTSSVVFPCYPDDFPNTDTIPVIRIL